MKVDIFITTIWSGNFAEGTGAYGILLQVVQGDKPVTREHYAGWSRTSIQKLNARAAAEALNYMTISCDVVIHTDNTYVEHVAQTGETNGKYGDIWLMFFAAKNRMKSVTVVRDSEHEYAGYLKRELEQGKYTIINDK